MCRGGCPEVVSMRRCHIYILLLGIAYTPITICGLRDFPQLLIILNTTFTKDTLRSFETFTSHAGPHRWPVNSGAPKILNLILNKVATSFLNLHAPPRLRRQPAASPGPKEGEGGQGGIIIFDF